MAWRSCWTRCLALVNILLKELWIFFNKDFFPNLPFNCRLRYYLTVRFANIYLDNRVIDKRWFIIAKGNKDGLFVNYFCSESKWKLISSMQNVFIEESEVRIISYWSVYQRSSIYVVKFLHCMLKFLKWYKINKILVVDSFLKTWLCRSHLLTHITKGTRMLWVRTPSGRGKESCSSSCCSKFIRALYERYFTWVSHFHRTLAI